METGNYKLKVTLSDYLGAYVKDMENENGEDEPYICIPLRRNGFIVGPTKKIYAYLLMKIPRIPLFNGWTHTVLMHAAQDVRDMVKAMGLTFPIIGKARPLYTDSAATTKKKKTFVRRTDYDE